MRKREPVVLYFTRGITATPEEVEEYEDFPNVKVRNGSMKPQDTLEETFAVAGNPPEAYLAKYPLVRNAEELRRIVAGEGVDPAPAEAPAEPAAPAETPSAAPAAAPRGRKPGKAAPAAKTPAKTPAKAPTWSKNV